MKTTFTYVKDHSDPLLNIRIATDAAGHDDNANRAAVARYFDLPESGVSAELDGRIHALPDHRVIATIERVTMTLEPIENA